MIFTMFLTPVGLESRTKPPLGVTIIAFLRAHDGLERFDRSCFRFLTIWYEEKQ